MDDHPEAGTRLQDNPGGIGSFLPFLRRYAVDQVTEEELMALRTEDFRPASTLPNCEVRRATLADLDALAALYAEAEHMSDFAGGGRASLAPHACGRRSPAARCGRRR